MKERTPAAQPCLNNSCFIQSENTVRPRKKGLAHEGLLILQPATPRRLLLLAQHSEDVQEQIQHVQVQLNRRVDVPGDCTTTANEQAQSRTNEHWWDLAWRGAYAANTGGACCSLNNTTRAGGVRTMRHRRTRPARSGG